MQIETLRGIDNLSAIAIVSDVDGVFIGPADLYASMGHLRDMNHPDVLAAIERCIIAIRAANKAAGILMGDEKLVQRYLQLGCTFVAVGADTILLSQAADHLVARFKAPQS